MTDLLKRVDISVLSENLVLIQTLLSSMSLLQFHTERQIQSDDRLVKVVLVLAMSAHAQHLVQRVQRVILLVHFYKLLCALERVLRVLEVHHPTLR